MRYLQLLARPHRSPTQMGPIVTDGVAWSVCRSIGRSVCHDREPCKKVEPMKMSFGLGWA